MPCRRPINLTRSGTSTQGSLAGSRPSSCVRSQLPRWRSSLACLSSALQLDGTVRSCSSMRRAARRRAWSAHPGDLQVKSATQIEGGVIQGQLVGCHPKIECIAAGAAAETMPAVAFQMGGERAAARRAGTMNWAWATHLVSSLVCGHEAQQFQHLVQAHPAAQSSVINPRHHGLLSRGTEKRNP
jgi:hypothetical protein